MLDEVGRSILKRMYDGCCSEFSIKEGRFLCNSIKNNKNTVKKIITADKSCYYSTMDDPYVRQLENSGYIATFQPGVYVLTSKGVWEVESYYYGASIDQILDEINEKYRCDYVEITERNKVILFATIAAHAFTVESSLKFKGNYADVFLDLIKQSCNCLYALGRISITYDEMITGTATKTPRVKTTTATSLISPPLRSTAST